VTRCEQLYDGISYGEEERQPDISINFHPDPQSLFSSQVKWKWSRDKYSLPPTCQNQTDVYPFWHILIVQSEWRLHLFICSIFNAICTGDIMEGQTGKREHF